MLVVMERPMLVIFFLVGYAGAYEWHFGNDNPNYVYIEYLDGTIWPLGKSTRVTISVPPCMLVKYVWVAVVNLISNPTVTYNKDTFTVMIEYGLLASSMSGYHVVAKGMRDPACGGGGTGGGDPHCPVPVCPPQHCSVPSCPLANCVLPNEPPRCPPANCPPVYCPPPSCPPPHCPRPQCPPASCPLPTCPPPQCYYPYVPVHCPQPYCPGCPQVPCNGYPPQNRHILSGKKQKTANAKLAGGKKNGFGRQRDQTLILDYIDGRGIHNATGTHKKRYEVIDGNGNIMDYEAYDFEDDDDVEDTTDFLESNNVKPSEVKNGGGGEKHDLMLLIVSDKKDGTQTVGDRNDEHGRGYGYAGRRPVKKTVYTKNSGYNKGSGDGLYGNSEEATGSRNVKSIGYLKGVRYDWGNKNAEDSVFSGRDHDEHKVTIDYGGNRGKSGGSEHDNSDSDRDWGYGYDANIFYPGDGSRGRASSRNDRGSNNNGGSALCSSYYNAKSRYGGNKGNGKGSTYTGSDLCDENATVDDGFVVLDRGSGYGRIDDQIFENGYGSN